MTTTTRFSTTLEHVTRRLDRLSAFLIQKEFPRAIEYQVDNSRALDTGLDALTEAVVYLFATCPKLARLEFESDEEIRIVLDGRDPSHRGVRRRMGLSMV